MCLALGTGYQLSLMGTPTCCLFMWPGLAYKVETLRVTSQERDTGEDGISFVVKLLSHVQLFAPPWTAPHQASMSFTISQSLLKLMSIESVMLSNHLILCRPLLLLPSIFPSIKVFYNETALCIRWPKYWSFSFNISPSKEYSGLSSFRMDWVVSPCSRRDSQESSPTPQFKGIIS